MTPERWRRVQEVFAEASERNPDSRPGFLDDACKDDSDLRHEVQSLLSALHEASPAFLESPAVEALRSVTASARPLAPGTRLGPYEILDQLGAGGMGAVYRARDTRLGREVAVKVLPAELASDASRLRRFEKEARSASALNHPNIVTIHDVGFAGGMAWIAMERVDGKTLRELISRGPLPVKRLLAIASQIADGLATAHAAGIVHRDLKPENVMVTGEERVKILDFGLAKPAPALPREGEGTPADTLTSPGLVVGTVGYMSPEQARGHVVDFRSDQFSFGAMLYEMATGRRAFARKTGMDTLAAILHEEPSAIGSLAPLTPAPLRWIVERCLAKEPRQRYSATDDLSRDLSTLRDHLSEAGWTFGAVTDTGGKARGRPRALTYGLVALALALAAAAALVLSRKASPPPRPEPKLRQLTSNPAENSVRNAAISPDGNYLAYVDGHGMRIRLVGSDETRAVSAPEGLGDAGVDWELGPWLPNSTRFFAVSRAAGQDWAQGTSQGASVWSVSVLGGAPRKIRDEAVAYGVSPDGSQLAFGTNRGFFGDHEIWIMDPSGGNARRLFASDEKSAIGYLGWTPDGRRITYLRTDASGTRLISREAKGGAEATIFTQAQMSPIDDLSGLPDGRILYTVRDSTSASPSCDYWEQATDPRSGVPVGSPRRLTNLAGSCPGSTTVTSDGKRAAFVRRQGGPMAYVGDLEADGSKISRVRRVSMRSTTDVPGDWMPDGKSVIVISSRTGESALYRHSLDDDTAEQMAPAAPGLGWPRVSGDDQWILYLQDAPDGKSKQVMRVPVGGGPAVALFVAKPESWVLGTRSPDLAAVIAEPTADRKMILSAIDPEKGRGRELLRFDLDPVSDSWFVEVSPDGTRVATMQKPDGPIRILSLRGEPAVEIRPKDFRNLSAPYWTADGRGLYVSSGIQGGMQLLHLDLQGNAQVIWTDRGMAYTIALPSRDGRHIALMRGLSESNVWLMEGF